MASKVLGVLEDMDQLDLEVELVARADSCPHCAATKLEVHERRVVAGRVLKRRAYGLPSFDGFREGGS